MKTPEDHGWRPRGRSDESEPRKGGWLGEAAPRDQAQQGLPPEAEASSERLVRRDDMVSPVFWRDHSGGSLESRVEGAKLTGRVSGRC